MTRRKLHPGMVSAPNPNGFDLVGGQICSSSPVAEQKLFNGEWQTFASPVGLQNSNRPVNGGEITPLLSRIRFRERYRLRRQRDLLPPQTTSAAVCQPASGCVRGSRRRTSSGPATLAAGTHETTGLLLRLICERMTEMRPKSSAVVCTNLRLFSRSFGPGCRIVIYSRALERHSIPYASAAIRGRNVISARQASYRRTSRFVPVL
jgi:hypothetical protein